MITGGAEAVEGRRLAKRRGERVRSRDPVEAGGAATTVDISVGEVQVLVVGLTGVDWERWEYVSTLFACSRQGSRR